MTKILDLNSYLRFRFSGTAAFLLLVGLSMSACKRNELAGLEVLPAGTQLGIVTTDTITLVPYTVRADSLVTSNSQLGLLGSYSDPQFGYVEAGVAAQLRLSSENVNFGSGTLVADSVVLALEFNALYGNTDAQSFQVYEVTEDLDLDNSYYSNYSVQHNATPIGTINNLAPRPFDDVVVDGDTLAPQVRMHLNQSFGQQLLDADASNFATNTDFVQYFKGIYIVPNNSGLGIGEGGIWYLSLLSSNSKVTLYFHDSGTNESQQFDFAINEKSPHFSHYEHDYTGTVVETALANPGEPQGTLFVHSMGGLNAVIEMPYLNSLQRNGPIAVNKAELICRIDGLSEIFVAHAQMRLDADIGGGIRPIPDFFDVSRYDGVYSNNTYTMDISEYIQQVLNGSNENTGLIMKGGSAQETANRTPIEGIRGTADDIKLKISYTPL